MTNKRILFLALLPVSAAFVASNHRTRHHNTRLSESSGTVSIALTREKGKNEKLAKELASVCDDLVNMPPKATENKTTKQALQESGLSVSFCPSRAIATSFV